MNRNLLFLLLVLTLTLSLGPDAQAQRVDSKNTHYRVWAIDRVIIDAEGVKMPAHAAGMLAFVAVYNADDTLCLVEYVAAKHKDFAGLRQDKSPRVRVFEKAFTKRRAFEAVARAAGFTQLNFKKFIVRVP